MQMMLHPEFLMIELNHAYATLCVLALLLREEKVSVGFTTMRMTGLWTTLWCLRIYYDHLLGKRNGISWGPTISMILQL